MQLKIYDETYQEMLNQYELTQEQLMFTGNPIECVQLSQEDTDRASILVIVENRIVTFFVLHINDGVTPYSNNKKAILLRAFSTDVREQRKGFAKKTLTLLPNYVRQHYQEINEIVLSVNIQNEAAQVLYKSCGYVDKGERRMGRNGELIIMSYEL